MTPDETPQGEIRMDQMKSLTLADSNGSLGMKLAVAGRVYYLMAESEEDFQKWWLCLSHPGRCTLPVHIPGEAAGWVLHTTIDGEGPGNKPASSQGERRWAQLDFKDGVRFLVTEGGKLSSSSQ